MIWPIVVAIVISASITLVICRIIPQQKVREINAAIIQKEERINQEIEKLEVQKRQCAEQVNNLNNQKTLAVEELNKVNEISDNLRSQAQKNADTYYQDLLGKLKYKLQKDEEQIQKRYEDFMSEYQTEYSEMLTDYVEAFKRKDETLSAENESLKSSLLEARAKAEAIVAANKRAELERSQKDFYRIVLSDEDIEEIKRLRQVLPYLRDKEPLNKVIYKVYYEKPLLAMIGRVLGVEKRCGIYKITNLADGKCYIGQSVSVSQRWIQHCKRGTGAETPTNNKLYPILYATGIENFMFELVEECAQEQLNEREKYYQEVFHAQDFGYSIR